MTRIAAPAAGIVSKGWGWRHSGRKEWALRDLNLEIYPGETVLLAGASGAGKSTLLHGLAGILDPEEGDFEGTLNVSDLPAASPSLRGRIGLVQQDPESQIVMSRVGDEVAFGLENAGVPAEKIWSKVKSALEAVGLNVSLDHPTAHLSGGQKQRLALACAFAMEPEVILLDEPTANLDPQGTTELLASTREVADRCGATLVIVEHNLEPWLDQIDRMVVLDRGRMLTVGPVGEVLAEHGDRLREAGVWVPGESVQEVLSSVSAVQLPSGEWNRKSGTEVTGGTRVGTGSHRNETPLAVRSLAVGYSPEVPVNRDINLDVKAGKVTSIIGPNGAGKTTLALTLAGLLPPLEGTVEVASEIRGGLVGPPDKWTGPELLGRISLVFQEPEYQFLTSTVEDEMRLGPTLAGVEDSSELVDTYLKLLRLDHLRQAHPQTLSGGEKRRLSVASALICAPRVLVLDEPTFGQDRNTWAALVQLLLAVAAQGTTVVCVTHDQRLLDGLGCEVIRLEPAPEQSARSQDLAEETRRESSSGRKALIYSVNPVAQLIGLVLLTVPLMVTIDPVSAAIALIAQILLLPTLGMSPLRILKRVLPILVAAPLAVISMVLYGAPGGTVFWQFGPAVVSENSVMLATALGLRVLAVGMPAILILSRIDATDMADALTQILKMPSQLVLASLAGIRMAGLMVSDWRALARARRSRGMGSGNRFRAFYQGAFAMLTFALRRAGSLSLTMEARGFGSGRTRSNARKSVLGWADLVMVLLCVSVSAFAIAMAVSVGAFRWFGL